MIGKIQYVFDTYVIPIFIWYGHALVLCVFMLAILVVLTDIRAELKDLNRPDAFRVPPLKLAI